jgi:hypothetical protein
VNAGRGITIALGRPGLERGETVSHAPYSPHTASRHSYIASPQRS